MSWSTHAERSGGALLESDFEQAAYKLLTEQAIYASDRGSLGPYDLITKHYSAYRECYGRVGLDLRHNSLHSYLVLVPRQNVAGKMRLAETRLALALRKLYDDRMHEASIENGEARVTAEELEAVYREALKMSLPERGALRELIRELKRYGIVRLLDEDPATFQIAVRPAINEVIGETTLLQLASYASASDEDIAGEEVAAEEDDR